VAKYIETVSNYNRDVAALKIADKEIPAELAESLPAFPQPYYNEWVSRTETATHTYNFCISPPTPSAIRGVIWIPGQDNVNEDVAKYTPSLEVYATSLAETYGQALVPFIFAQPSSKLVGGIGQPAIPNSASIEFDAWPKSMKEIATQLGGLAAGQSQ
jgi:hypothetical protein